MSITTGDLKNELGKDTFRALVRWIRDVATSGTDAAQEIADAAPIRFKKVDIGDWDMNQSAGGSATTTVAHGLTWTDIISVTGYVRNDADDTRYGLGQAAELRIQEWDATNVTLVNDASSQFDGTDFDDTGYNRGEIMIIYSG